MSGRRRTSEALDARPRGRDGIGGHSREGGNPGAPGGHSAVEFRSGRAYSKPSPWDGQAMGIRRAGDLGEPMKLYSFRMMSRGELVN